MFKRSLLILVTLAITLTFTACAKREYIKDEFNITPDVTVAINNSFYSGVKINNASVAVQEYSTSYFSLSVSGDVYSGGNYSQIQIFPIEIVIYTDNGQKIWSDIINVRFEYFAVSNNSFSEDAIKLLARPVFVKIQLTSVQTEGDWNSAK